MTGDNMVVKIQLPLVSSEAEPKALIYNEDQSLHTMMPVSDLLRTVIGDELKAFFEVTIKDGNLVLEERLEGQGW